MTERQKAIKSLSKALRKNIPKHRRMVMLLQMKCLKLGVRIKDLEKLYAIVSK